MTTPNIFDFATSELSQDATLAYMLAWASPDHKTHSAQHNLGVDFLRALLDRTKKKSPAKIETVVVQAQVNRMDVSVVVNGEIFLILEDKTNTDRHSGQIVRYVEKAKSTGWKDVRPIYIKTGNETAETRVPTEKICRDHGGGHFYRNDLLNVLHKHTDTGDEIIDQFRLHLEAWESATEGFRRTPVEEWDAAAYEGYYFALESALENAFKGHTGGWNRVENAAGGFWGLWTCYHSNEEDNCTLYLQIQDGMDLFMRCGDAWNSDGKQVPVSRELRLHLFEKAKQCASQFAGMQVVHARGREGKSSNFAKISFDNADTYMAFQEGGKLDFDATVERMKKAGELVAASCK